MDSLFDLIDEDEDESTWHEVPQALFDSWSEARQLAYCAARDEDSAAQASTLEELNWYRDRANAYKEMIKCLTTP